MDQTKLDELFCFRQESGRLLLLCMTQLSLSLNQSDSSMASLTHVFQNLVQVCSQLEDMQGDLSEKNRPKIEDLHQELQHNVNDGIVAFQFYDRLSQQLSHIQTSLDQLSELIQDSNNLADKEKWLSLRDHICSSYSMESEHLIFKSIMDGMSADEAMSLYYEQETKQDDIELF